MTPTSWLPPNTSLHPSPPLPPNLYSPNPINYFETPIASISGHEQEQEDQSQYLQISYSYDPRSIIDLPFILLFGLLVLSAAMPRRGEEEYGGLDPYEEEGRRGKRRRKSVSDFFEEEAHEDSDGEEEEDEYEGEEDFIDSGDGTPHEDDRRDNRHSPIPLNVRYEEEEEDIEEMERRILERYSNDSKVEYGGDEGPAYREQPGPLPSLFGPKMWLVKCKIGCERELAIRLMQKSIDVGSEMKIFSAIALDHLKGFIYVEAKKEVHVKEAVTGMQNIYPRNMLFVPMHEMTDVLSVQSEALDISSNIWVRVKTGMYQGDLAKVVIVDSGRQRAKVKLIPRIDMQALADKMEGRQVPRKKSFIPPARLMNINEARALDIHVERKRDQATGDYFDKIGGLMFKNGFLYKSFSLKSLVTNKVQPTFDEVEKFRRHGEATDSDMSNLLAPRNKTHFIKGDTVIVVKGDLRNLKGVVEKVQEDIVHVKPNSKAFSKTLAINNKELCKCFEPGDHVKVVFGATEGITGLVVSFEGHAVTIVSDTTKELVSCDYHLTCESKIFVGGMSCKLFGCIRNIVLFEVVFFCAFQVLKGAQGRSVVAVVRLREIKNKIYQHCFAKDRFTNALYVKDIVKILDGPCKGKQGRIEHIYRGVLFIYDRYHHVHGGYMCVKSESCVMIGGSLSKSDINGNTTTSRVANFRTPSRVPQYNAGPPSRGTHTNPGLRHEVGNSHNSLVGAFVKIRLGNYKGYKGRVVEVKAPTVRVELESQMKVVTVDRNHISDNFNVSAPIRYDVRSETPMQPPRTPLRQNMTPMRDSNSYPRHYGMRTPMHNRAWIPFTPTRESGLSSTSVK
ncbi:Putative transcription elongation factor SPT5 homolog 1 [Striga hermonthica]|uniref:Transcription elongation factor SPT5 homolog 1 n=1 Tax=Striga hermonthica TaxID=68872 RepID=A0A9N7MQB3_STRHE|nr:Putative transcription elongation factor SPT5 homolog 1 [Striga hermonthica]